MGVYVVMNLGVSLEQMSVIPGDTAVGAEVSIHTFRAIGAGMLTLLAFLICNEHLFSMPALFFAYDAAIHIGGFESG